MLYMDTDLPEESHYLWMKFRIKEDIIKESELWACKCCVLGGIGCTIWETNSDLEFRVQGVY